ncbi:hypothetical protein [Segetibacter sp.]|jgi:hypothetical protein|uniref:hypothetical protein n=1 Tax=Segetibacter sp. TaxID=2231182 RepID=UPI00261DDBE6|nr:hypothetical protein [Segetibacter sp.]MCW3078635.1 hypothetical protein [Segetibacter sp.]
MKQYLFIAASLFMLSLSSCKKEAYEWEDYTYTAVPIITVNTAKSALPTVANAKTSFFNIKDPNLANQQFEFVLNWEGFGKQTVTAIDVYVSFNKREASAPSYPIVISTPGDQYPNIFQYPLPSIVRTTDKFYETATTFPKTYTFTAAQLATITGFNLNTAEVNDYILFKFMVTLADGRKIVSFFNNICDESRGEPGDCRVGVRFRNQ